MALPCGFRIFRARFAERGLQMMQITAKGLIDVSPLITHSFPLAEYETAIATASDRGKAMKVQLEFA